MEEHQKDVTSSIEQSKTEENLTFADICSALLQEEMKDTRAG